jgi:PPOX class probable F420-dependent enzyme
MLGKTGERAMVAIPEKYMDLMTEKKALANVATVMADGSPQVTPVWFDYVDGKVRINTAKGRVKARTMTEGAKVALAILDPDNPYRYIQVRGVVAKVTEQGADAHIDSLAKKYLGKDKYPFAQPGEVRVMLEIEPQATQTMG